MIRRLRDRVEAARLPGMAAEMRAQASQVPPSAPCRWIASIAYSEQLGVKRHCSPHQGFSR
jgi:hypothetical protein